MKTYWDLPEKDRAALTEEAVAKFADAELMTKGVLKVDPPALVTEPEIVEPAKTTFYKIQCSNYGSLDIIFASLEQAQAFLALAPMRVTHEHLNGNWSQSVEHTTALESTEIKMTQIISEDGFLASKSEYERRAAARDANEKERESYKKAIEEQNKALAGMWDDWHKCRAQDARMRKVSATFESYTETAQGDRSIAFGFLRKVFADLEIIDAAAWCGFEAPNPFYLRKDRIEVIHFKQAEEAHP
jgi:hypothetical protein